LGVYSSLSWFSRWSLRTTSHTLA